MDELVTQSTFEAAKSGNIAAKVLIGESYLYGKNGLKQNWHEAFQFLDMAWKVYGSSKACLLLSHSYEEGIGRNANLVQAYWWALQAKRLKAPDAEQVVARIYQRLREGYEQNREVVDTSSEPKRKKMPHSGAQEAGMLATSEVHSRDERGETHFRTAAVEVVHCRHCDNVVQTSEVHLRKALLCQECFDARESRRKAHPTEISAKTEINEFGDQYGRQQSIYSLVCASCGRVYQIVPGNYVELSIEEQRKQYELDKQLGGTLKEFKPILLTNDFPKQRWRNQRFCQRCSSLDYKRNNEVTIYDEEDAARIDSAKRLREKEEALKKWKRDADANFAFKWQVIIMAGMLLFLLFSLGDCSGNNTGGLNPRHF